MEIDLSTASVFFNGSSWNPSDLTNLTNTNIEQEDTEPIDQRLVDGCVYTLLFLVGAPANLRVLFILVKNKLYHKTRHHQLLLNLAVADTMVCCLMIPIEVGWRITGDWRAGNVGCKLFQFVRVFGLYVSSMVLIVISIDRYYAVMHPFSYSSMGGKINQLLIVSWIFSAFLSLPQAIIFTLQKHPVQDFYQCVCFDFFPSLWMERMYNICSILFLYGLPLFAIITCYTVVSVRSIYQQKKSAAIKNQHVPHSSADAVEKSELPTGTSGISGGPSGAGGGRKASSMEIDATKSRTTRDMKTRILKQTLIIVATYLICWTPYAFITVWYQIDSASVKQRNIFFQNVLFLFAVSNSIINPFIYGKFVKDNPQRV